MQLINNLAFSGDDLLAQMMIIRFLEEALAEHYSDQRMRCPMHLCIGQEAIAVGVSKGLSKEDKVFSNHRSHGHYIAKGGDMFAMVAEIFGKASGCSGGRGGSMHLIDLDVQFMGSTPIVGGTVPLAVGTAWASKLKKSSEVTVVYFGDGCFEEGVIHEAFNFSVLHSLPIIYICENNGYSVYTEIKTRQPSRPIFEIAKAHGMHSVFGNGNDVEEVLCLADFAINSARNHNGPQFLELETYRWREHCGPNYDDSLGYRTTETILTGKSRCPIKAYSDKLVATNKITPEEINDLGVAIRLEVNSAITYALNEPEPSIDLASDFIYAK